jgi:hypothetical protein
MHENTIGTEDARPALSIGAWEERTRPAAAMSARHSPWTAHEVDPDGALILCASRTSRLLRYTICAKAIAKWLHFRFDPQAVGEAQIMRGPAH